MNCFCGWRAPRWYTGSLLCWHFFTDLRLELHEVFKMYLSTHTQVSSTYRVLWYNVKVCGRQEQLWPPQLSTQQCSDTYVFMIINNVILFGRSYNVGLLVHSHSSTTYLSMTFASVFNAQCTDFLNFRIKWLNHKYVSVASCLLHQ